MLIGDDLYFYDLNNSLYSVLGVLDGTNFTNLYLTDKINIYKTSIPDILQKIIGFNTGMNVIRKTHYFDAKVIRSLETLTFLKTNEDIIKLIESGKPIHTKLKNLTVVDDLGVFDYGGFGIGLFGNGEYSIYR